MKLLLTDSGIRNPSITAALLDLLGKPIAESTALCIPTAGYGGDADPYSPWLFTSGRAASPMTGLGWKAVGTLELTALPGIDEERWVSWVREADVLLANGGSSQYLGYWMRESGLADLLPSLPGTVYVGLSAGSMVMGPRRGEDLDPMGLYPAAGYDTRLGMVDFSMFVHLNHPGVPERTMAAAERWGAGLKGAGYATDAQTAIKVVDGVAEVVSEGTWKAFNTTP